MTPIHTPNPYEGPVWGFMDEHGGTYRSQMSAVAAVTSSALRMILAGPQTPPKRVI